MFPRQCLRTVVVLALSCLPTWGQEPSATPAGEPQADARPRKREFHLGGEVKAHFRHSSFAENLVEFPFPASFLPPGETKVFERTVSKGDSFEVSTVTLLGEGDLAEGVSAKIEVRFSDLYNRNPTTSDDRILVRQAWVRLGRQDETLESSSGTSAYLLLGLAPRFSKQLVRRMESYGLWGTAVGRFEEPQLQVGGSVGGHVYWRALLANGNPLFFRDPNALAGDNGTPERVPGNVHPILESGFPILYDAKPADLNLQDRFEWGLGLGTRGGKSEGTAWDLLGWYFKRQMADTVPIRGTFYSGDIKLLKGVVIPLPFSGRDKKEYGLNLALRASGLRLFGQYVRQDIATLKRRGFEVEAAWVFDLHGLFLAGEDPVGNWIQPVIRVSSIDNLFEVPELFPGTSVGWDWKKYDLGVRFGIVRQVDLTLELSRNDATVSPGVKIHPDEFMVTLRAGF